MKHNAEQNHKGFNKALPNVFRNGTHDMPLANVSPDNSRNIFLYSSIKFGHLAHPVQPGSEGQWADDLIASPLLLVNSPQVINSGQMGWLTIHLTQ